MKMKANSPSFFFYNIGNQIKYKMSVVVRWGGEGKT